MALFISLEGGEGSGKSTQARLLRDRFLKEGQKAILVHEPGGTSLGDRLRNILLQDDSLSDYAELFLFSAARSEIVSKVIKPSLDRGITVISDRYVDSTTAYQGYGRGIDLAFIRSINTVTTQGLVPDLTFLLDMEPAEGLGRVGPVQLGLGFDGASKDVSLRLDLEGQRRFEEQPIAFHRKIRNGYLRESKTEPDRWVLIDATSSEEDVQELIWDNVRILLMEKSS